MSSSEEKLRVTPLYKNTSQKYLVDTDDFPLEFYCRQYFVVYRTRVNLLTNRLIEQSRIVLGKKIEPTKLDQLEINQKALIIGTIIKKTSQRPSVLTEFELPNFRNEEDEETEEQTQFSMYNSVCLAKDELLLENVQQRIVLDGNIDKNNYVTGFVVAVYGIRNKDNFTVEQVIHPKMASQIPRPVEIDESYVMFLSGLSLDSNMARNENTYLALTQLINWIHGCDSDEEVELARRVSRVVIAGDSVNISCRVSFDSYNYISILQDINQYQITKTGQKLNFDPSAIEQLDRLLENLVRSIPVDVMSGSNDICDTMLPQQPMVVRSFDKCHRFGTDMFNAVSNPYSFQVDGVSFLGTAGQNLHDSLKYTRGQPLLSLMRQFLERSYLFPTCPDTLDGFPLQNNDPFIISEIPHVFFVGNQSTHEAQMCELDNGACTLLMTIPKFSEKFEAVLLNIKSMETQVFRFEQMLHN